VTIADVEWMAISVTKTLSEPACNNESVVIGSSPASQSGATRATLRSQVLASALLIVAAIVGVFVVPTWADSTLTGDGTRRVTFDERGSFVPAGGWSRESAGGRGAVYSLSGTTFAVDAAQRSDATVQERIVEATKVFDDVASWQVEPPVFFTTASGTPAARVTAHQADGAWVVSVVADGEWTMRATTIAPDSSWLAVRDDVDKMTLSIELPEADS
jgi:hypothetical protein